MFGSDCCGFKGWDVKSNLFETILLSISLPILSCGANSMATEQTEAEEDAQAVTIGYPSGEEAGADPVVRPEGQQRLEDKPWVMPDNDDEVVVCEVPRREG